MFTKNKEDANATLRVMNQFGQGTVLDGDITTEGDIRIDGKVNGDITSKAKVVVGATGVVDGNISCQNAYIDGRINGHIEVAELLILSRTASVSGNIKITKLVVEEGARFSGNCSMGTGTTNRTQQTPGSQPKNIL